MPTGKDARAAAATGAARKGATRPAAAAAAGINAATAGGGASSVIAGVALTHPERVLWPDPGITKGELAAYLAAAAPRMLPHVAGRPLSLLRAPQGIGKKRFFQRHPSAGGAAALPAPLRAVMLPGPGGAGEGGGAAAAGEARPLLAVEDAAGLVALAQMGVVEIHPWGSTLRRTDRPDRLVFDLDPAEDLPFDEVVAAAQELRGRLEALGLAAFCKTTGGKGLHLVVPLLPRAGWAEAKALARSVCEAAERDAPERFVLSARKAERAGQIYLDYLRNDRGASAVAPYSPRARPGAPVAMPLAWDEVVAGRLAPAAFHLRRVAQELLGAAAASSAPPDPWTGFPEAARPITPALLRRAEG